MFCRKLNGPSGQSNSKTALYPWLTMKTKRTYAVSDAKGQAQIVLRIGGIIRQRGANVISLQHTQSPVPREVIVDAAARLKCKRVGALRRRCASGIKAIEAMHSADESLAEDLVTGHCCAVVACPNSVGIAWSA